MEIEDFKKLQKKFDDKYIGPYNDLPADLLFLTTALAGEVGEFANLVKKYYRLKQKEIGVVGEEDRDYLTEMKKEIIDVFVYFLIIANQLNLDVNEAYWANLERNKKRFSKINNL
ncbi:MAG: nucleotide pyrophosphohydrolase [Candidatus Buchananbacteria bacterium]|nr:nucleotide pyrophosphohydrolase [Candidatus Buchananbacteria bacterium]